MQGLPQNIFGVFQFKIRNVYNVVIVHVVLILKLPFVVFGHPGLNSGLGLVFHPLAHEHLVFLGLEEGALALLHVVDPVAFVVVPVAAGEYALACAFALVPLAFVDVSVGLDHASFAVHDILEPVAVLARPILHPESAFPRAHVVFVLADLFFK